MWLQPGAINVPNIITHLAPIEVRSISALYVQGATSSRNVQQTRRNTNV
jgi:hypothetical protein